MILYLQFSIFVEINHIHYILNIYWN